MVQTIRFIDSNDFISFGLMILQMGTIIYAMILLPTLKIKERKTWPWFILMLLSMFVTRWIMMMQCMGSDSNENAMYTLMFFTSVCLIKFLRLKSRNENEGRQK